MYLPLGLKASHLVGHFAHGTVNTVRQVTQGVSGLLPALPASLESPT